ncbi:LYR motif containing protein 1 [Orchesella cincta]|uniref:LYR motif containing protein 1 n=1 Tax=Orchesella cincta TaxID=48709 RepID=A0A1D2NGZ7_ORCCI|nr:LYR motif containing protein 1 [Orchesella cincta]
MSVSIVKFTSPYRSQVLSLYRRILKLGATWTASSNKPSDTAAEREFITSEAKALFRQNQNLTDPKVISDCIHEAQARLELANHYKTPYPRPVNVPPNALARRKGKEQGSVQERIKKQSVPIYIKSKVDQ